MSSQPPTTPRIEDLRARLRLDPKARHFYPLAEELRKLGQVDEAEKILREGLTHHPAYLSAWVSLGRVLAEKGAHRDAVEALTTALSIDPGNVVCANLLSTSYLALGEKVEALKKLKLVRAVMPGDEVDEQIAALEQEIAAGESRPAGFAPPAEAEAAAAPPALLEAAAPAEGSEPPVAPAGVAEAPPEAVETPPQPVSAEAERTAPAPPEPLPWEGEAPPAETGGAGALEAREGEPAPAAAGRPETAPREDATWQAPAASPFLTEPEEERAAIREPLPAEADDILPEEVFSPPFDAAHPSEEAIPESPAMPEAAASPAAEPADQAVPESMPLPGADEAREPFPAEEPSRAAEEAWPGESEEPRAEPAAIADDRTATLTMADLYAKQGHDAAARDIYERVLERDPSNQGVRERLAALSTGSANPERERRLAAAARLERWLEKVGRREL